MARGLRPSPSKPSAEHLNRRGWEAVFAVYRAKSNPHPEIQYPLSLISLFALGSQPGVLVNPLERERILGRDCFHKTEPLQVKSRRPRLRTPPGLGR